MEYGEQIFSLRKYARSIGAPENILDMLMYFEDNKDDLPEDYRQMYQNVMNGFRKMFLG